MGSPAEILVFIFLFFFESAFVFRNIQVEVLVPRLYTCRARDLSPTSPKCIYLIGNIGLAPVR